MYNDLLSPILVNKMYGFVVAGYDNQVQFSSTESGNSLHIVFLHNEQLTYPLINVTWSSITGTCLHHNIGSIPQPTALDHFPNPQNWIISPNLKVSRNNNKNYDHNFFYSFFL